MNHYETVFILNPVLSEKQIEEATQKYVSFIKTQKGKLSNQENWGLKKLAYTIENKTTGFYHLFEFTADVFGRRINSRCADVPSCEFVRRKVFDFVTDSFKNSLLRSIQILFCRGCAVEQGRKGINREGEKCTIRRHCKSPLGPECLDARNVIVNF